MRYCSSSNRLVLGTAQFGLNYGVANDGGQVESKIAKKILNLAWDSGIDTLDTAIAYGKSEEVLGSMGVKSWNVITKLPAIPKNCTDVSLWVRGEIKGSLHRLRLECVDSVLLHHPSDLLGNHHSELIDALMHEKISGHFKKLGVSIYEPDDLSALLDRVKFDLVQAPLNILDRRIIESGWLDKLHSEGIEIHARSIFLQGLLLMDKNTRPTKFDAFNNVWNEWARWLKVHNVNPLQACISYALGIPEISKVLVGVDSCNQLEEIIQSLDSRIPTYPDWPKNINSFLLNPSKWSLL